MEGVSEGGRARYATRRTIRAHHRLGRQATGSRRTSGRSPIVSAMRTNSPMPSRSVWKPCSKPSVCSPSSVSMPQHKRSYRVNFDKFTKMAQGVLPVVDLQDAVTYLRDGLLRMRFQDSDLRTGEFVRLVTLKRLRENGHLNDNLEWKNRV